MRERIKIIANPFSGGGRGREVGEAIRQALQGRGCAVELVETERAGDARLKAQAVDGFSAVGCIGGDGTVNEVLNGLPLGAAPPLAMIPCGTANVLAKELRLPRSAGGLARVITDGREIRWDLGVDRVSGRASHKNSHGKKHTYGSIFKHGETFHRRIDKKNSNRAIESFGPAAIKKGPAVLRGAV